MTAPALDTSGRVAGDIDGLAVWYEFEDLAPFAQGYVEAIFAGLEHPGYIDVEPGNTDAGHIPVGFRHLAPEALAMILRDCEGLSGIYSDTARGGALFWSDRLGGHFLGLNPQTRFPPLRVYLNDDGKVALSQASGEAA